MWTRKISTLVCIITLGFAANAQQDPQFSQNMFLKLPVNPAFAGSNDAICATVAYRNQWVNFDGAPKTGLFTLDAPIRAINSGIGLTLVTDKIGFDETFGVKLAYAYRAKLGSGNLGIGVEGGIQQKSLSGNFIYNDPNDPNIPLGGVSATVPDFGAGIYFNTEKFYIGASSSHLTEGDIDYGQIKTSLARHYYGMIGYTFDLTPSLALKPSVFVKSDEASTQIDANMLLAYNNRFWGGVSYRLEDAIVAMVGMNITNDLKLGYSYDITTSSLNGFSNGTHEILLGYCFNVKSTKSFYMNRNVRFL